MEQKAIASELFKDKKDNYPQSVPKLFLSTRLSEMHTNGCTKRWMNMIKSFCNQQKQISSKILISESEADMS